MAVEYKGDEFLYLVEIPDESSTKNYRLFNQTDGNTDIEADSIELDTKDKTGEDYGKVSQSISIEGILTEGDEAVRYIKKAIRQKRFVKIIEVNTRTLDTEEGAYMISSFGRTFSNGDYATYSIEGSLNGEITEGTLQEVPEGAPESKIGAGNGGEGAEG